MSKRKMKITGWIILIVPIFIYLLVSSVSAQGSGANTSSESCENITPKALNEKNLKPTNCSTNRGANCVVVCKNLFRIKPSTRSQIINCYDNGTWSPLPTCRSIGCRRLQFELKSNQTTNSDCFSQRSNINGTCSVQCATGYKFLSSNKSQDVVQCTLHEDGLRGVWNTSALSACEQITCPRWIPGTNQVAQGACRTQRRSINTTCKVNCKSGYKFFGMNQNYQVKCKQSDDLLSAKWAPEAIPNCQRIVCPDLNLTNLHEYTLSNCRNATIGTECSVQCHAGYKMVGSSTSWKTTCILASGSTTTAKWSNENPPVCQEIKCGKVESSVKNGVVTGGKCSQKVGSTCTLSCPQNYKFDKSWANQAQSIQMNCTLSASKLTAEWKSSEKVTPICEEIRCPNLTLPKNGHYASTNCAPTTVGKTCNVRCEAGYKFPNGSTIRNMTCSLSTAKETAAWTPSNIQPCKQIKCAAIRLSDFGIPKNNDSEKRPNKNLNCDEGLQCQMECPGGYVLSTSKTSETLTCNINTEVWSPSPISVGLCRRTCEYWISTETANSNTTADQRCNQVLGTTAALAMPKRKPVRDRLATEPNQQYFVGAYFKNRLKSFWNDGTSAPRNDPCSQAEGCKSNSKCIPIGCSFRCECPNMIFGSRCQRGPFTINITKQNGQVPAGQTIKFSIGISNNADVENATFHIIVNGKRNATYELQANEARNETFLVPNAQFNTYVGVHAFINGQANVTQQKCDRIQVSNGTKLVEIMKDLCDGSALNVQWKGLGDGTRSTYYDVFVGKEEKGSALAGQWYKITGLKPVTNYKVKVVPRLTGCLDSANIFQEMRTATGRGPPNASVVTISQSTNSASQNSCIINWKLIQPKSVGGYKVKIVERARVPTFSLANGGVNETSVDIGQGINTYNITTRPNSIYNISVGTVALDVCKNVPIKWSTTVVGCATDASAPTQIYAPTPPLEGSTPTIQLTPVNERNGLVSCYFVIVRRVVPSSNSSETVTDMSKLKQANATVVNGENYIARAIARFDSQISIVLGDGQRSCCSMRNLNGSCRRQNSTRGRQKRATATSDAIYAENRPLEPGASYRHYILVSTPRSDGQEPYLVASPFSNPWRSPSGGGCGSCGRGNPVAVIVPLVLVAILVVVAFAAFFVYRKRHAKPKQSLSRPRVDPDDYSVEPGVYIDLAENPDDVVTRELAAFSLRLSSLFEEMNRKREDEDMEFLEEFKRSIPAAIQQCKLTYDIAHLRGNQPKNRYKNIIPYDRSRVVLNSIPGVEFSDYVNASYIDGYSYQRKFIASQGPKPETIADFWRMILEQNCHVIAMLTRLAEKMKVKCAQYWPEEQGQPEIYGDISVTLLETVSFGDFIKRNLQVSQGDKNVRVDHFQFIAWPDHGIPTTTSSILRFHNSVMCSQPTRAGPIVVHCSAGVGRTGTFIALDHLSNQIAETDEINIAVVIARMRTRRPEMVQTLEQYIFIHKLVLELYQFGDTDVDVSVFNETYRELTRNPNGVDEEFAMLEYFLPLDTSQESGKKEGNMPLNRNPLVIPYDHNAAFVQMNPTDKTVPYYNASVIASYHLSNNFIAAQNPDQDSKDMFWRTIMDNEVNMIVALFGEQESSDCCYWPNKSEKVTYGPVSVRTFSETTDDGYTERIIEVSNKQKKMEILQVVYNLWPEHTVPSSSGVVLDLIAKVEKNHQTLASQERRVTLVHCSDGAGRTGTFCAISNLIERLKNENKVDVFRTAKDLRDQRPLMIQTPEQYEFCYRAISDFLQLFDLYGNFQ